MTPAPYQKTACILCAVNCGIEVRLEDRHITHVRGDREHPTSAGYLCQKAQQLDHYQNHDGRLSTPLRRREDGTFEAVGWDTALPEIAARMTALRAAHGGVAFGFYGGGGQGNHLGGPFAAALRSALGTRNYYNALSQEKTGEFWVNGKLFGSENAHLTEDFEHCEVAVFLGANPWQSHGFPRARVVLKEIQADPRRKMIVVDPRRTETAAMADLHLAVRPGGDAWLLAAINAQIVRDGNAKLDWLAAHTHGFEEVLAALRELDAAGLAARAGVPAEQVRLAAKWIGEAESVAIREDLGLQQTLHSTLSSYLDRLLSLLTGNFAKRGANNLHTTFFGSARAFAGDKRGPERTSSYTSPVTGHRVIQNLLPPNILPQEILADHPRRLRALIVESANPALTGADTLAYREALARLELLVVIDVAMTETARLAHYVLPAPSQFEKWEATSFSMHFPDNVVHFRQPVFPQREGTLQEAEIYTRLLEDLGAIPRSFPELAAAARERRADFAEVFGSYLAAHPELLPYALPVAYRTLGPALPDRAAPAAFAWLCAHGVARRFPAAMRRAGHESGEALFQAILASPSGVVFTVSEPADNWNAFIRYPDGKIPLAIPELLTALGQLPEQSLPARDGRFPFVLNAGERRAYNANQIFRGPAWRKQDRTGALRIHPEDAARLALAPGDRAVCRSKRAAVEVDVWIDDGVPPGVVTLPHGFGMEYRDGSGELRANGPAVNVLTAAEDRDEIAGTPFHKYVPVAVEKLHP